MKHGSGGTFTERQITHKHTSGRSIPLTGIWIYINRYMSTYKENTPAKQTHMCPHQRHAVALWVCGNVCVCACLIVSDRQERWEVATMCTYVCVCGALEIGQLRLGLVALGPAQAEKSPGAQTRTRTHTHTHTHTHTSLPAKTKMYRHIPPIYTKQFKSKCSSNIYTQRNNGFYMLKAVQW